MLMCSLHISSLGAGGTCSDKSRHGGRSSAALERPRKHVMVDFYDQNSTMNVMFCIMFKCSLRNSSLEEEDRDGLDRIESVISHLLCRNHEELDFAGTFLAVKRLRLCF